MTSEPTPPSQDAAKDELSQEAVPPTASTPNPAGLKSKGHPIGSRAVLLWGALVIFLVGLGMRLWRLDEFPAPVFDEVYFPEFAQNYLDGKPFFDVHPPLGKYFIALSIQVFGRNEWGFRLATALCGSLIPLLLTGLAYRLTYHVGFALLSGALLLTDGVFLVESRFGLINVYLVVFGLAATLLLIGGLERHGWQRAVHFTCSGVMLGAAASVKWNGLWFALMFALLGILVWGVIWLRPQWIPRLGIWVEIRHMRWWHYAFCFILTPLVFYALQWIPHLQLNPHQGLTLDWSWSGLENYFRSLVAINQSIYGGQTAANLVVDEDTPVHPYCSTSLRALLAWFPGWRPWLTTRLASAGAWSWPIMGRPVGYYFSSQDTLWRAVHGLGNPWLWWLGTGSILVLIGRGIRCFQGVEAFILIGYAANYLPWFMVSRCVFIYHYMSALAFSTLALAWLVSLGWRSYRRCWRGASITAVALVLATFIFFFPLWFGLPLSPNGFYARMWFRSTPVPLLCFSPARVSGTPSLSCQRALVYLPAIPGLNWI
ncbi:MAG: phospholipid carrier-dependent glycosyltransferase [Thermostichus sp. DG_1_6_bins_120]